tara:strand:+ start:492 stop:1409 length:918 start_codon:yes stop_codon:yes gene_type:complete
MFDTADTHAIEAVIKHIDGLSLSDSRTLFASDEVLPMLVIDTPQCQATIAMQGAQLLNFERKTDALSLVWCSPKAVYKKGKAVRGGIPVCFPWFGAHPSDNNKPNHGFVRDHDWQLDRAVNKKNGELLLSFKFNSSAQSLTLFPHEFEATLEFNLGQNIDIYFKVDNLSDATMPVSWALHSYLPVTDINSVSVDGLDQCRYLDTVGSLSNKTQVGPIYFNGEVDRVYSQVPDIQTINTAPAISITGDHCPTAIVWNPGCKLASSMNDLGAEASTTFICVERGAALSDAWRIDAGTSQSASVKIRR